MHIPLEIAIECALPDDAVESAVEAIQGGADRLELCASMQQDGLTPLPDVVSKVRAACPECRGILCMIRPRPGGFLYAAHEIDRMTRDIGAMAEAGADGVVFGALRSGTIDLASVLVLKEAAVSANLATTFHRAFDAIPDRARAYQTLEDCGIDRVLTAGTPWGSGFSAAQGADVLRDDLKSLASKIEVVAGGGITLSNLPGIVRRLRSTAGAFSVHVFSAARRVGRTRGDLVQRIRELLDERELTAE
jgi:copper homeostasis protein